MKKYRLLLMVLLLSFLPLNNIAKAAQEDFRVIGYYSEGLFDEPIENLQMDKLTHIMYAFLCPLKNQSTCGKLYLLLMKTA